MLKKLRGFLGLTNYYRKFVKNYGQITTPLTMLLKKEEFYWTEETTQAFETIKEAMCTTLILATIDFKRTFFMECDASSQGIGVFLMKEVRLLSFERNQLKGKKSLKPIYEK
jgi:hypothetical protein